MIETVVPTPQNGQTHSNTLAITDEVSDFKSVTLLEVALVNMRIILQRNLVTFRSNCSSRVIKMSEIATSKIAYYQ